MLYEEYLGNRKETFKKSLSYLLEKDNIVIVELGTSRSFKSWGISNDVNDWHEEDPSKWAWSDGCFTRLFADNLKDKNFIIYTIDPCPNAINVVRVMIGNNNKVKIIKEESTNFLNNFNQKIDLLYMDHLESGEQACKVHLEDSKIILEKDLMKDDGTILIDDSPEGRLGKGKYSIPYLLNNGYTKILHEYQVILKKI
jgi:hypothetical protein